MSDAATGEVQAPVGAVFAALADPTRRHVVRMLAQRPTVTASALAEELPISRQAVAKHLSALADAGLVAAAHEGRETRYRLTPKPLTEAMQWLALAGARWDESLARLTQSLGNE
ncbi:MAG TPA: metalloregulator ArsR/SmtB family transcription factor [Solirubrobacteraceae bacterium]|jgi:DNA-binding transcriptional ArsR family regulator